MKKLLGILVLGLLLHGCQSKPDVLANTKLMSDIIFSGHYNGLRHHVLFYNQGNIIGGQLLGVPVHSPLRLSYGGSAVGFEEANARAEESCWMMNKEEKGTLLDSNAQKEICWIWRYFTTKSSDSESSIYSMVRHDADEFRKLYNEQSSTTSSTTSSAESSKIELTSMIDDAKETCKSLGFKEGTEKFSDCSLKLYSQSVEIAAKQNQQIVSQGSVSGSNVVTIYDPVRDRDKAFKRAQGLINGTCTLEDLSKC